MASRVRDVNSAEREFEKSEVNFSTLFLCLKITQFRHIPNNRNHIDTDWIKTVQIPKRQTLSDLYLLTDKSWIELKYVFSQLPF